MKKQYRHEVDVMAVLGKSVWFKFHHVLVCWDKVGIGCCHFGLHCDNKSTLQTLLMCSWRVYLFYAPMQCLFVFWLLYIMMIAHFYYLVRNTIIWHVHEFVFVFQRFSISILLLILFVHGQKVMFLSPEAGFVSSNCFYFNDIFNL